MKQIKVLVIENSDIMLQGIVFMLKNEPEIAITNTVEKFKDISEAIKSNDHDVVLLGPMIIENYEEELDFAISTKYPDTRLVKIEYEDDSIEIVGKIKNEAFKIAV